MNLRFFRSTVGSWEAIEGYLEVKAARLREQTKGERVEVIVEALLSWREVVRALGKVGFAVARQRGSHVILVKRQARRPGP